MTFLSSPIYSSPVYLSYLSQYYSTIYFIVNAENHSFFMKISQFMGIFENFNSFLHIIDILLHFHPAEASFLHFTRLFHFFQKQFFILLCISAQIFRQAVVVACLQPGAGSTCFTYGAKRAFCAFIINPCELSDQWCILITTSALLPELKKPSQNYFTPKKSEIQVFQ